LVAEKVGWSVSSSGRVKVERMAERRDDWQAAKKELLTVDWMGIAEVVYSVGTMAVSMVA
jgi:hypothetical protein